MPQNLSEALSDLIELTIPIEHGGRRLDQSLAELLPEYSRSRLVVWIDAERVRVNGNPGSRKMKVWGGESVQIEPEVLPSETSPQAEDIALDIAFEDDEILVINKPAGLVTHPGAGNWEGTLLNALLHHTPGAAGLPRAGIVHRLDKDTSGLMVVAKTLQAQTQLVRDLQERTIKRIYWAIVHGTFDRLSGEVNAAIGRHPTQRTKMAVVGDDKPGGKPALTYWTIKQAFDQATWVECRLATGRTHQIRVHMTHIGHPLVGDMVYRGRARAAGPAFHRQALHAVRLGLNHPITGEEMEWEAAPPEDFQVLLAELQAAGTKVSDA